MRELLERWHAVHDTAPGVNPFGSERRYSRLSRAPDAGEGYWRVIHSGYVEGWKAHPDKGHGRWDIFAAVVEAVEARGWDYRLAWRMAPTGEHFGVIRIDRGDGWSKDWSCYAGSPAAALLGAYLSAVEAASPSASTVDRSTGTTRDDKGTDTPEPVTGLTGGERA